MAKNLWIGVEGVARRAKNMYIGVDGVARKVKAAWIGVDGVAKLFYKAATVLAATMSRYKNANTTNTAGITLPAYHEDDGHSGIQFGGSEKFANFSKATLYLYVTSCGTSSISNSLYIWLRNGGDGWFDDYNVEISNNYRTTKSTTTVGLHAYDITDALKELYEAESSIVTKGLKVYLRSYNNIKVAGHANTSYQTPYIELE